jgi:hypothetical protein
MATVLADIQWDAFLKELYPDGLPAEIMMRKHVLLSKIQKDGDAYGEYMVIPVVYDNPSGRSADIASLLGATGPIAPTKSASSTSRWRVGLRGHVDQRADDPQGGQRPRRVRQCAQVRGGRSPPPARQLDGARALPCGRRYAAPRVDGSWTITGTVITLRRARTRSSSAIGMQLDFIANSGGAPSGALPAHSRRRTAWTVTKVDEDAGAVTCDSTRTAQRLEHQRTTRRWRTPTGLPRSATTTRSRPRAREDQGPRGVDSR